MNISKILIKITTLLLLTAPLYSCTDNSNLPEFKLSLENHRFSPEELVLPENTKTAIIIDNKDDTAEEFECLSLRKEKILPAGTKTKIIIQPLTKGSYEFFGEFNPGQAKGKLIVQ